MLGATVRNIAATATWRPGFLRLCITPISSIDTEAVIVKQLMDTR
jgi:hypothetical protein